MNIRIQITYLTEGGRAQQSGTFQSRGKKPEVLAFEWLKQIKRKVNYKDLISVIVDNNVDITDKVIELEKAPLD